jgi:hypothetical protein
MGALFFARADMLNDSFEGSIPKQNPKYENDMSQMRFWLTQCTFMNCWHLRPEESVAMWKLYSKSEYGVAIKSTYKKLINSLPSYRPPILVGMVTYIDYDTDKISDENTFLPFMHKRKAFEHEHEVRAVIQDLAAMTLIGRRVPAAGTLIEIDLPTLIEEVYIGPASPSWFAKLVERLCTKYDIGVSVVHSRLDEKPIY